VVQVGFAGSVPTHLNGDNSGAEGEIEELELLLLDELLTVLLLEELLMVLLLEELLTVLLLDELLSLAKVLLVLDTLLLLLDSLLLMVLLLEELLMLPLLDSLLELVVEELESDPTVSVTVRTVPALELPPTATVMMPFTVDPTVPPPVLDTVTVVFIKVLVSEMVTVAPGLNDMAPPVSEMSVQLAPVTDPAEVAGVSEKVPVVGVLPVISPEKLNVTEAGVAPVVTLQTTIWSVPGVGIGSIGRAAAFLAVAGLVDPFFTCFVACGLLEVVWKTTFDGLAWVCPIAAANRPLTSRMISDSLFIVPPLDTECQIWSVAVSRL
jgi:hypothetical protein